MNKLPAQIVAHRQKPQNRVGATRGVSEPVRRHAYSFGIATSIGDITDALRLVYNAYAQKGLVELQRSKMRLTKHHLLPSSEVLLAKLRGEVVCTATLVLDNPQDGLPMDSIFFRENKVWRDAALHLAETTCLACQPASKAPLSVVTRVMALTIQCAKMRGADRLLATVHPDHVDFYTSFLGFEVFGGVKLYPSVRHHPAVPICLDLNHLHETHPKGYKRAFFPPFPVRTLRQTSLRFVLCRQLRRLVDPEHGLMPPHGGLPGPQNA